MRNVTKVISETVFWHYRRNQGFRRIASEKALRGAKIKENREMETVVKLDGLIKKYDNKAVVDGLSLEIREGEIFGLLGPNGAGKSTTMNMVCSLLKPTAGTIEVFGYNNRKDINKMIDEGILPEQISPKDMGLIAKNLPKRIFEDIMKEEGTTVYSVEMLDKAASSIGKYDRQMEDRAMVIMEPPSIDPRIVNQYAFFSVIPGPMNNIELFLEKYTNNTIKYIINKNLKWRIRDFLDEANISERTVYPGLDGICKWLARHYYVKKD